jgi:predicted nucleic acid-binding protein
MILADTSVVIDWLRLPSLLSRRIIGSHQPSIRGVSLTELLVGVRTEPERSKLMRQLAVFGRSTVEEPVWEIAGRIGAAMESAGFAHPFPGHAHRGYGHPSRPPSLDA